MNERKREEVDNDAHDIAPAEADLPLSESASLGPSAPKIALALAASLFLTNAVAVRPSFAGRAEFYAWSLVPWTLAALGVSFLAAQRGVLRRWLAPRPGDFTLGALLGGLLVLGVWLARTYLLEHIPAGGAWIFAVYVQLGDARAFEALLPSLGLALAGFSYEIVVHGYAQEAIEERWGPRVGYWGAVGLSASLWLPSTVALAEPGGGRNPLFLAAGIFSGLLLGALRRVSGRLTPGIVARIVFLYFTVAQFRLPGL